MTILAIFSCELSCVVFIIFIWIYCFNSYIQINENFIARTDFGKRIEILRSDIKCIALVTFVRGRIYLVYPKNYPYQKMAYQLSDKFSSYERQNQFNKDRNVLIRLDGGVKRIRKILEKYSYCNIKSTVKENPLSYPSVLYVYRDQSTNS